MTTLPERGSVVSVRGGIVDLRFERHIPVIHSLLRAGKREEIVLEVLSQLTSNTVRYCLDTHARSCPGHAGQGY